MAHINIRAVKNTCNQPELFSIGKEKVYFFSEVCIMGKQTRNPYTVPNNISNFEPGEKIHTDVCGPSKQLTRCIMF